jgi:hypothetical protein
MSEKTATKAVPAHAARPVVPSFGNYSEAHSWLTGEMGYTCFGVAGDVNAVYLAPGDSFDSTYTKEPCIHWNPVGVDGRAEEWPEVQIAWQPLPRSEDDKKRNLPVKYAPQVVEQTVVRHGVQGMPLAEAIQHASLCAHGRAKRAAAEERERKGREEALLPDNILRAKERFLAFRSSPAM